MSSYMYLLRTAMVVCLATMQQIHAVWISSDPVCQLYLKLKDGTLQKTSSLSVTFPEATSQSEIEANPSKFRTELFINGEYESQMQTGFRIDYPNDFNVENDVETHFTRNVHVDPRSYFKFVRDTKDPTKLYIDMVKMLDRDGPTANNVDDLDIIKIKRINCVTNKQGSKFFSITIDLSDVNDNAPQFTFLGQEYSASIQEGMPPGVIFTNIRSVDLDANQNKIPYYDIIAVINPYVNTTGLFGIPRHNVGEVNLLRTVDFEPVRQQPYFLVIISATDNYYDTNPTAVKRTSTATLTVSVVDIDDQYPAFYVPGCKPAPNSPTLCLKLDPIYNTETTGAVGSLLDIMPVAIKATDLDSLNYPIQYGIATVYPKLFEEYIAVNPETGAISIVKEINPSFRLAEEGLAVLVSAREIPPTTAQTTTYKTILATLLVKFESGNPKNETTKPCSTTILNEWTILGFTVLGGGVVCLTTVVVVLKCCAAKAAGECCWQEMPDIVETALEGVLDKAEKVFEDSVKKNKGGGERVRMYSIPKGTNRPAVDPNDVYVDLQGKDQQEEPASVDANSHGQHGQVQIQREAPGGPEHAYIELVGGPEPEYEEAYSGSTGALVSPASDDGAYLEPICHANQGCTTGIEET